MGIRVLSGHRQRGRAARDETGTNITWPRVCLIIHNALYRSNNAFPSQGPCGSPVAQTPPQHKRRFFVLQYKENIWFALQGSASRYSFSRNSVISSPRPVGAARQWVIVSMDKPSPKTCQHCYLRGLRLSDHALHRSEPVWVLGPAAGPKRLSIRSHRAMTKFISLLFPLCSESMSKDDC